MRLRDGRASEELRMTKGRGRGDNVSQGIHCCWTRRTDTHMREKDWVLALVDDLG